MKPISQTRALSQILRQAESEHWPQQKIAHTLALHELETMTLVRARDASRSKIDTSYAVQGAL